MNNIESIDFQEQEDGIDNDDVDMFSSEQTHKKRAIENIRITDYYSANNANLSDNWNDSEGYYKVCIEMSYLSIYVCIYTQVCICCTRMNNQASLYIYFDYLLFRLLSEKLSIIDIVLYVN